MSAHREKYARCVEALGREALLVLLPKPPLPWRDLVAGDEHLNNVPLELWDRAHNGPLVTEACPCCGTVRKVQKSGGVLALYVAAARSGQCLEPGGWSLCNSVCTLKELATQLAESGK